MYDFVSSTNHRFLAYPTAGQVVLGHATTTGLVTDATVNESIRSGVNYTVGLTISGSIVTVLFE